MSKPVIVWGRKSLKASTMEIPTHHVIHLKVDRNDMVHIGVGKGIEITSFSISIEHAQDIGLINLDALEPLINKM